MTPFAPATLALRWADGPYAGMAVDIRPMSIATYGLSALDYSVTALVIARDDQVRALLSPLLDAFVAALVEWNLPYTADRSGVDQVDPRCLDAIVKEWVTGTVRVPDPLGAPSTSGESFPEASIPMDVQ